MIFWEPTNQKHLCYMQFITLAALASGVSLDTMHPLAMASIAYSHSSWLMNNVELREAVLHDILLWQSLQFQKVAYHLHEKIRGDLGGSRGVSGRGGKGRERGNSELTRKEFLPTIY